MTEIYGGRAELDGAEVEKRNFDWFTIGSVLEHDIAGVKIPVGQHGQRPRGVGQGVHPLISILEAGAQIRQLVPVFWFLAQRVNASKHALPENLR